MKRLQAGGILALVLLLAQSAWAHPGHGSGLPDGIAHPFSGIDHIAAMLAVGLWASQLGPRALWRVPLAFVVMMLGGAALAMAGISLPLAEPAIAASVLVLGLLIMFATRMPLWTGMGLVGLFAIFHGWSHGAEMTGGSATSYALGFAFSTILLHAAGVGLGVLLAKMKRPAIVRFAGASLALLAICLFAGAL